MKIIRMIFASILKEKYAMAVLIVSLILFFMIDFVLFYHLMNIIIFILQK